MRRQCNNAVIVVVVVAVLVAVILLVAVVVAVTVVVAAAGTVAEIHLAFQWRRALVNSDTQRKPKGCRIMQNSFPMQPKLDTACGMRHVARGVGGTCC